MCPRKQGFRRWASGFGGLKLVSMTSQERTPEGAPTIIVGLINDGDLGALAYALHRVLSTPAHIQVLRVAPTGAEVPDSDSCPLEVIRLEGDAGAVLVEASRSASAVVVQSAGDGRCSDAAIALLRRSAHCELIEVDEEGCVVEAARTVTVGFDGSVASMSALTWALAHSDPSETIDVVTAYLPASDESAAVAHARAMAPLRAALKPFADELRAFRVIATAIEGTPVEVLLERSEPSQLIVVGRHGTNGLIHSVLGSVGEACARLAHCPVVIIPPESNREDQTGTDQMSRVPVGLAS